MSDLDVCGDRMPPFAQDLPDRQYPTCVLPAAHEGLHADSYSTVPPRIEWTHHERAPWRFDVPAVPAHVTAVRSEQPHGRMWFRTAAPKDGEGLTGSWWIPVRRRKHDPGPVMHITDLATYAPLVECPDPRAAS